MLDIIEFFFSSRRRHTRCALVTGVQTCALPIFLRPAVPAFGEADLLLTERRSVRGARILLMRRPVADMALHDDQRRPVVALPKDLDRRADAVPIVGVANPYDVPAIGGETRCHVLAEIGRAHV